MFGSDKKIKLAFKKIKSDIDNLRNDNAFLKSENIELREKIKYLQELIENKAPSPKKVNKDHISSDDINALLASQERFSEEQLTHMIYSLSAAEREIINELSISYENLTIYDIGKRLNKAPDTIRKQLDKMILKGFPIHKMTVGINNSKVYFIDNKYSEIVAKILSL